MKVRRGKDYNKRKRFSLEGIWRSTSWAERIITLASIISVIVSYFTFSAKVFVLTVIPIFILIAVLLAVYVAKRRKDDRIAGEKWMIWKVWSYELLLLFCLILSCSDFFGFAHGEIFALWPVALGVALVTGALITAILVFEKYKVLKYIGSFCLITLLAFITVIVIISNLNYALDRSEPERYVAVIENENVYRYGRRARRSYEFTVTVNGDTFDVDVPRSASREYDEGDYCVIHYYKGAFDKPYYVYVGSYHADQQ